MNTLTDRIIAHVERARFEHLPAATVHKARRVILDTLVTATGGLHHPDLPRYLRALDVSTRGDACVWGTRYRTSQGRAAFINAFLVHNNEYDPLHERAVVHVPATVLPALLAHAQANPEVTGRQLITAFCVAVDVAATVGCAQGAPMRFFRPAMAGALGAAAGLAHLMALDANGIRRTMSLTASQVSGTLQAHTEGTSTLAWQMGVNARGAIVAATFARAGMEAPRDFLQGPFGYLASYDGSPREQVDGSSLGQRWEVDELSHKPYPSGRATHAAIDAVRLIRRTHEWVVGEIEEVEIDVPPLVWHLAARPPLADMTPNYACLCLPYVTAVALVRGSVRLADFRGDALKAPDVLALAQKIRLVLEPNRDANALAPVTVRIRTARGSWIGRQVQAILGSPTVPFDEDALRDKAAQCLHDHPGGMEPAYARLHEAIEALDERSAALVLSPALCLSTA